MAGEDVLAKLDALDGFFGSQPSSLRELFGPQPSSQASESSTIPEKKPPYNLNLAATKRPREVELDDDVDPSFLQWAQEHSEEEEPQQEQQKPQQPRFLDRLKMRHEQKWSDNQLTNPPTLQNQQLTQQQKLLEQQQLEVHVQQLGGTTDPATAAAVAAMLGQRQLQVFAGNASAAPGHPVMGEALVQQQQDLIQYAEHQGFLEMMMNHQQQLEQYTLGQVPQQKKSTTEDEREAKKEEDRLKRKAERDPHVVYKIAKCRFFDEGKCSRGSACTYAHGEEELRPPDRSASQTSKTAICKYFLIGKCLKNVECRFAHGAHELKKGPQLPAGGLDGLPVQQ